MHKTMLYMTGGANLWLSDITTGEKWNILPSKRRGNIVNGFDYIAEPLAEVLSGNR